MTETYIGAVQTYTVTSENDRSVASLDEIPEKHILAVRNAVQSSITISTNQKDLICGVNKGLIEEEQTPPNKQDIAVSIETENVSVSTKALNEIKEELKQTALFKTLSLSVTSRTKEMKL